MRIGKVATLLGVSTSKIRFYERHGLIDSADRKGNGYRNYDESVVDQLRKIMTLSELGFSLSQIKSINDFVKICCREIAPGQYPDVLALLHMKHNEIELAISKLKRSRKTILEFIGHIE